MLCARKVFADIKVFVEMGPAAERELRLMRLRALVPGMQTREKRRRRCSRWRLSGLPVSALSPI
jgi:hypothetical protein